MSSTPTTTLGTVGVDTAQLLIIDPSYLLDPELLASVLDQLRALQHRALAGQRRDSAQLHYPAGHAGLGVVFHTGIGDGTYPVHATFAPGLFQSDPVIASVTIPFLPHPVLSREEGKE